MSTQFFTEVSYLSWYSLYTEVAPAPALFFNTILVYVNSSHFDSFVESNCCWPLGTFALGVWATHLCFSAHSLSSQTMLNILDTVIALLILFPFFLLRVHVQIHFCLVPCSFFIKKEQITANQQHYYRASSMWSLLSLLVCFKFLFY